MKRLLSVVLALLALVLLSSPSVAATRAPGTAVVSARPSIDTVKGRTVRVRVPAGLESVTLERCVSARLGRWEIVATKPTAGTAGTVEFQLPAAVSKRFLRVKGAASTGTAGSTLAGARLFLADPALARRGAFDSTALSGSLASGTISLAATGSATDSTATRTVSESDIWRVAGDRLYFFNELRGLQVLDITNPDDPGLLGQLRAPGSGEQMYLLDANHVALLTRGSSYLRLAVASSNLLAPDSIDANAGSVVTVDVTTGKPVQLAQVEYRGALRESRLVGSVLYVVSEVWGTREHGLEVTSFDLTDPAHPVARATLFLGNYGGVITATDRFLFVVSYSDDWNQAHIDIIDISSPTGALVQRGRVEAAGRIEDKFKMHLDGDTFTAISAIPRTGNWWERNDDANNSRTKIETFSLANPDAPAKLGALELGVGETVHATRFDDKRLYVVTFFTIDPLWVVDLTNPATPTLLGELEVPGFSSYIEPLGDRLVAVGIVNGQTAVSLFDVSDPAHPAALSQLPLGDGSSWSEANHDEKAFNVMPEENLIVVPYSGYDASSGYANRVQLIDLTRNALVKRGVIEHGLAARRTAVKGNRLLAISATDLVTVDFADRDHPRVTSEVEIAWRVDRVFLAGNYLLQLGGSANWRKGGEQTLTVSTASDPETALATVVLDAVPVLGATVRDGRLYLAQKNPDFFSFLVYAPDASGNSTGATADANSFILSVFDLTGLPAIPRLARTTSEVELGYVSELSAVWPSPGVLVWVRGQSNYWGWNRYMLPFEPITSRPIVINLGSAAATIATGGSRTSAPSSGTLTVTGSLASGGSTAGLVKQGLGTLILSNAGATFTGTSTVAPGTVGNDKTLFLSSSTLSGSFSTLVTSGTLITNPTNSLNFVIDANGTYHSTGTAATGITLTATVGGSSSTVTNPSETPTPPPSTTVSWSERDPSAALAWSTSAGSGIDSTTRLAAAPRGAAATITAPVTIGSGATLSPGSSVGTISAGTLRLAGANTFSLLPYWGSSNTGYEALVFDVSTPATPVLAAKLNIRTGSTGDWSEAFGLNGKLYVSAMAYEDFVTIGDPATATSTSTPSKRYRHFLRVVDLATPATPVVGAEVNIPGRLLGVTNGGARLYTVGCKYDTDTTPMEGRALHASTFDGTAAAFVDQLALADYGSAYALDLDTVLLGRAATKTSPSRLQAYQLDTAGKFQLASELNAENTSALAVVRGLLVTGSYGPRHLYDVTDAAHIRDLGALPSVTPYWYGSDLRKADGTPTRGLWEPLGQYGVNFVEFAP